MSRAAADGRPFCVWGETAGGGQRLACRGLDSAEFVVSGTLNPARSPEQLAEDARHEVRLVDDLLPGEALNPPAGKCQQRIAMFVVRCPDVCAVELAAVGFDDQPPTSPDKVDLQALGGCLDPLVDLGLGQAIDGGRGGTCVARARSWLAC